MTTTSTEDRELHRASLASRCRTPLILTAILLLAIGLRWHDITARGFFFDELWITELSNGHGSKWMDLPTDVFVRQPNLLLLENARPIWQVPQETKGAIHPPATFVVLRLWREAFGDSMLALRSCSATWSVLVVLLCFLATRQSFGTHAGLWAALLSAVSLGNIDQAQDVRGYTMLQALTLLTGMAFLRLRGRPSSSGGAIVVGLGTLLLMYTHYFAAGVCAAITVAACLMLRDRTRWQTLSAIGIGGIVWVVTWWPHLREQLAFVSSTADIFLIDQTAQPRSATLMRLLASPYQSLVADPRLWPLSLFLIGSGTLLWGAMALQVIRSHSHRAAMAFWAAVVVGAVGVLVALDLYRTSKHLEYPKYLQLMNPGICVLLGAFASWGRRGWVVPAVLSAGLFVAYGLTPRSAKPDLRPQLAFLRNSSSPDDLFLLPARPDRVRDAQTRWLSLAHGLPLREHRIAIPVGPKSQAWLDALPHDVRWFCLVFADYEPETWQPGLEVVERGPNSSGVAVFELRPAKGH